MTADPEPHPVQLLTPEGERREHDDYDVDLTDSQLRGLYRDMVLVRRLDGEATALQRQGELGMWVPVLGQEAAQIGSARALALRDFAFPTYREHGVAWARGVDPVDMLSMLRGITHGGWDPAEHRLALPTIVIGDQCPHAVGYAMGIVRDGVDEAVICYLGDGATSQGDVNESFVFAAAFHAPVVFFCQNNQWAISAPVERQTPIPLYRRAAGFGFPGIQVDGNDVLAVYAVTTAALQAARDGQGPTLIEAFTYRMGAHTTSDDPTRYRDAAELEAWARKDPIARLGTYLATAGITDATFLRELDVEADELAHRLRTECRAMPDPDPVAMFEHAYAMPHPLVDAERAEFQRYQQSFLDLSADGSVS